MEEYTYKIRRLFFYNLFQTGKTFDEISEEIGYESSFLVKIIDGKIPISKNELLNILNSIGLNEDDLKNDNDFKSENETLLKQSFNLFMDQYDEFNSIK